MPCPICDAPVGHHHRRGFSCAAPALMVFDPAFEKRCPDCGAAINCERHQGWCSTRAEVLWVATTPAEAREQAALRICTLSALASLRPGGKHEALAGRLLP
jgi:hypothetical protein